MNLPPVVSPAASADGRPTWSVVIPVHNCARFLGHALEGPLAELGSRCDVEIVVIDDASSDDPESVVDAVANPVVSYVRLPEPHGAIRAFNACLEHSRGTYVHLLHGDDGVEAGFYAAAEAGFAQPDVVATVSRTRYIDELGRPHKATRAERTNSESIWQDAVQTLTVSNRVRPASIAARRSTYEAVGGFRTDLPHAADWEMWVRIAAHGPLYFIDEVLAEYRAHDSSDTPRRVADGSNIRERIDVTSLLLKRLPEPEQASMARRAHCYSSMFAAITAARCLRARNWRATRAQARAAVRCLGLAARGSTATNLTD